MALLKFKRSAVPAKVPALNDLALGELAINTYDGKVYTKKDDGTPAIVEIGGTASTTSTLLMPVRNNTGATLTKGTAVYINGALGQNSTVAKAIATSDATSAQTLGIITADLPNNTVGNVTLIGTITNINTSAYTDGQQLYLSPTTAGTLTPTKPYAPNHLVYMAVVEHAHPTQGKLFVKVQNGYEMDELHDVSAQNPANNDGLFYNTTSGLWEKKSIATALGYTPANKAGDAFTGDISVPITKSFNCYTVNYGMGTPDSSGLQIYAAAGDTMRFGHRTGGVFTERFIMGSGGNVTANVDFRAPIFYDSNDTAYYVDPNSNSNFIVVYASEFYNRGWFRTNDSDKGIYNQATGQHWYSDSGNYWNMGGGNLNGQGIRFRDNHQGTVRGYVYYDQSNNVGFLNNEGNWRARVVGGDYFLADGSSARAQIFYDSNDTAYYINGAGDSVLNTLYMRNGTVQAKFAQASNFGYSSSYKTVVLGNEYLTTISMGVDVSGNASGSFNGQGEGREVLFRNGVAFITPNAANTAYETPLTLLNGYASSIGSFRAPIFYDSNDTSRYLDPNGTSRINFLTLLNDEGLNVGGIRGLFSAGSDGQGISLFSNVDIGYPSGWGAGLGNTPSRGLSVYGGLRVAYSGGGFITSDTSVRSPIFYDNNDTGYYTDPASTSVLNNLSVNGSTVFRSDWTTRFQSGSDFVDGTLVTTDIPATAWAGDSFIIEVTGKSYDGSNPPFKAVAQGYLYADTIINFSGINYGGSFSGYIRVFQDGGVLKFWWPRISYWNSFNVNVMSMDGPTNNTITRNRVTSITNSTEPTGTKKVTINLNQALRENTWINSKYFGSDGAIYGVIFYDTNNSAYYIDPSTTGIGIRTAGEIYCGIGIDGDGVRINHDQIWTPAGNFHIQYSGGGNIDMCNGGGFAFSRTSYRAPIFYDNDDTGYYIDPNGTSFTNGMRSNVYRSLYGGGQPAARWDCSFYVLQSQHWYSHNGASTMYVGESGDFVYIRGYTTADGSSRSPIFYDSNDTGYYLDPNTTGLSLRVNGNLECFARSAAWSEGLRVRVPTRGTWGGIRFTRDEGNANGNWAIGFTGIDSTDDLTFWGNVGGGEGMRARLTQSGNFTATGNVTAYSDGRLKQDVQTVENALDLVSQMRGVTYTRKDNGEAGVGVIAQEMREIMPQVVQQDGGEDGTLSVAYGNLVGVLIEAIKELSLKVKTLEEKDNSK
jgi:hypothetical protein